MALAERDLVFQFKNLSASGVAYFLKLSITKVHNSTLIFSKKLQIHPKIFILINNIFFKKR
jgi:hypothetical protein